MNDDDVRAHARYYGLKALAELEQAGFIKRDTRTILDIDRRTLCAMAAAYEVARHWWQRTGDVRTLGDLMKTMPTEDAECIAKSFRWAGLLPEEEPEVPTDE